MKVKEIMRKATAFLLLTSMNLGSIGANTIYAADMTGDGTNVVTQVVPEPLKQGTLAVKVNSIGGTVETERTIPRSFEKKQIRQH